MSSSVCFVILLIGMVLASSATWQNVEDTGCAGVEGCDDAASAPASNSGTASGEEETNNKFALLFRQMLAKQRETNMDCALSEDCPDAFECISGKCRSMGPRRTKMINLYSRW
ncbi:unnamed protein product [Caenorhabditis brenneri]